MPTGTNAVYDFIVIGSGAGGGPLACNLAKRGFRVLVLEAGGDKYPDTADIPAFHALASEDPEISWEFFVNHYADPDRQRADEKWDPERQGVFYPRATGIGGCTLHNAMITLSGPGDDWDEIAGITGDRSWNSDRMRGYFERLENCHYAAKPGQRSKNPLKRALDAASRLLGRANRNPGRHGFAGYLDTAIANPRLVLPDRLLLAQLLAAFWASNAAEVEDIALLVRALLLDRLGAHFDPNHWERLRNRPEGLALVPMSVRDGRRCSVRDYVRRTKQDHPDGLTIWTDTLATEIIFDEPVAGQPPTAVGVRYQRGPLLYRAHPEPSAAAGTKGEVFCRNEVILCGGAFNTPQLLMLSGIGPKHELAKFDLPLRVNLPGVGTNLQDRYEVSVVVEMPKEFPLLRGLQFRIDRDDAALQEWERSHTGLYATNGVVLAILKKSRPDLPTADLCIFGIPGNFKGYKKGYSKETATNHKLFTWVILKAYTKNRAGTVRLRSANPRDTPEINFHYFSEGSDVEQEDVDALVAGVKFVRSFTACGPKGTREQPPVANYQSDDELRTFVEREAWGHHASCTCPIGADGDPMAVLDTDFRVRGVRNLRVVDASAFPRIPGVFIVANVYMISEKASDVIADEYLAASRNRLDQAARGEAAALSRARVRQ